MIKCVFEFFGIPREIAGAKTLAIEVKDGGTLQDAISEVGKTVPGLVGPVIASEGKSLVPPYLLNLNASEFIDDLTLELEENDHLLLMFPPAGG